MAALLQLLSLFVLLSLCQSESKGGPRDSVCNSDNTGFLPSKGHGIPPALDEEEYKVTVTLIKQNNNQAVNCVDNKTDYIGTFC